MNGRYVGYLAGDDPLHGFLSRIIRDLMEVREAHPAFRVFRLSGSNVVYAYQEKFSGVKVICKFYGPRAGKASSGTSARSPTTRSSARSRSKRHSSARGRISTGKAHSPSFFAMTRF